jgi:hypothetical protein
MSQTKLLIIILLSGVIALNLVVLDKFNTLLEEYQMCRPIKDLTQMEIIGCIKNEGSE